MILTVFPCTNLDVPETPIVIKNNSGLFRVEVNYPNRDPYEFYNHHGAIYGDYVIPFRSLDLRIVKSDPNELITNRRNNRPIRYCSETGEYTCSLSDSGFKTLDTANLQNCGDRLTHTSTRMMNRLLKNIEAPSLDSEYSTKVAIKYDCQYAPTSNRSRSSSSTSYSWFYNGHTWFKGGLLNVPSKELVNVDIKELLTDGPDTIQLTTQEKNTNYNRQSVWLRSTKRPLWDEGFAKGMLDMVKCKYDTVTDIKYLDNGSIDPRSFIGEGYKNHFALATVKFVCLDKDRIDTVFKVAEKLKGKDSGKGRRSLASEYYPSIVMQIGDKIPTDEAFVDIVTRTINRYTSCFDLDIVNCVTDSNFFHTELGLENGDLPLVIKEFDVIVFTPRDDQDYNNIMASTIAKYDLPMTLHEANVSNGTRVGNIWQRRYDDFDDDNF